MRRGDGNSRAELMAEADYPRADDPYHGGDFRCGADGRAEFVRDPSWGIPDEDDRPRATRRRRGWVTDAWHSTRSPFYQEERSMYDGNTRGLGPDEDTRFWEDDGREANERDEARAFGEGVAFASELEAWRIAEPGQDPNPYEVGSSEAEQWDRGLAFALDRQSQDAAVDR